MDDSSLAPVPADRRTVAPSPLDRPRSVTIKAMLTKRMEMLSELIRMFPRDGTRDTDGVGVGTYEWYAKQIVRQFEEQNIRGPDGNVLLPANYLRGGLIAAQAVGRDWNRMKVKYGAAITENIKQVRESEAEELAQLKEAVYLQIMEEEIAYDQHGQPITDASGNLVRLPRKVKLVDQYIRLSERYHKLLGLDAPTRSISMSLEDIPWGDLSRDEIDRLEDGEPPEAVLMDYRKRIQKDISQLKRGSTDTIIEGEIREINEQADPAPS